MTINLTSPSLVGTPADLQTFDGAKLFADHIAIVANMGNGDEGKFRWVAGSVATDTTNQLIIAPTTNPGSGKWHRVDPFVDLKMATIFSLADAAVLFTVPTGFRLRPTRPFHEITANWTGGTNSAVGVSSNSALANTKGDLLGGAGGDIAAGMLAANVFTGTTGAKIGSQVVLVAGNTIRWDRIVDAFTAGTGFLHVPCELMQT